MTIIWPGLMDWAVGRFEHWCLQQAYICIPRRVFLSLFHPLGARCDSLIYTALAINTNMRSISPRKNLVYSTVYSFQKASYLRAGLRGLSAISPSPHPIPSFPSKQPPFSFSSLIPFITLSTHGLTLRRHPDLLILPCTSP